MNLNRAVAWASPLLVLLFILGHVMAIYPSFLLFRWSYQGEISLIFALEFTIILFVFFPISLALIWGLIFRLLPKPAMGELESTRDVLKNIILVGINHFAKVTYSRLALNFNPLPGMLYYKIVGSKIHPTVFLSGPDCIADPYLISIGENSIIGYGALISGHFQPNTKKTILGKVEIGKDVLIGVGTLVLPNVIIGDGARVLTHSVVAPGTVIEPGETWQGVPAIKIK